MARERAHQRALRDAYEKAGLYIRTSGAVGLTINRKKYEAAIREYNKVIELNPKYAVAWNNRGAAKSWLNLMREAIVDYEKATEDRQRAEHLKWSNENADKVIDKALTLEKRGDFKGALKLLNEAVPLYPDNQFVYWNL